MNHFDGYWGCNPHSGKQVNDWNNVNCPDCFNNRKNHERSGHVMNASFLLNGCDLKKLRTEREESDPDFKIFRLKNFSDEYKELWKEFCLISKETCKLKTHQERYDYVLSLPESIVTETILSTAACWFSKFIKIHNIKDN